MPFTSFDPRTHGFHFPNAFENHVLGDLITTRGRCGGMAFAAYDYFLAKLPIPTHRPGDFGPGQAVPPDGSELADYIFKRLIDGFVANAGHWLNVALNPSFDVVQSTKREILDILGTIDLGQPVPLGLIATRDLFKIGSNHQVLAYGYELSDDRSSVILAEFFNYKYTAAERRESPDGVLCGTELRRVSRSPSKAQPARSRP
jgi:hypothetical protein